MKHEIDVKFYPGWTRKAISFSIDDGNLVMDQKFKDIVEPYGIKGTFNLCSDRLTKMSPEEYREFYRGYEIANHCKSSATSRSKSSTRFLLKPIP